MQELLEDIDAYMKELKTFGIQDYQVKNVRINFMRILGNILVIIPALLANLVFVCIRYFLINYYLESGWTSDAYSFGNIE